MQRQDAAKSLPNINAVFPNLASTVSTSQLIQQGPGNQLSQQLTQQLPPQQQQLILRSPSNNNIQSPLLLQPQNLHNLSRHQMQTTSLANKASTESLKPRSYSASSEMLLSNAQYKFNQNCEGPVLIHGFKIDSVVKNKTEKPFSLHRLRKTSKS